MLAEPRRRQKWTLNPRGNLWSKDEDKFGKKLLEKMGWKSGTYELFFMKMHTYLKVEQITVRVSSRLTASLNLRPIYLKLLVHVL